MEWEAFCPPLYEKQLAPDYLLILSSNFLGSFVLCLCSVSPLFPRVDLLNASLYGVLQRGHQPVTIKMFLILHTKQAGQAVLLFYSGRGGSKMSNIIAPHMPYIISAKAHDKVLVPTTTKLLWCYSPTLSNIWIKVGEIIFYNE